jgi:hypothetical protein
MALRLLVYRLLRGGLATCLETTNAEGAVIRRQWIGYRGKGEPHQMNEPPPDRIGPIRVVDVPDNGTTQ